MAGYPYRASTEIIFDPAQLDDIYGDKMSWTSYSTWSDAQIHWL